MILKGMLGMDDVVTTNGTMLKMMFIAVWVKWLVAHRLMHYTCTVCICMYHMYSRH